MAGPALPPPPPSPPPQPGVFCLTSQPAVTLPPLVLPPLTASSSLLVSSREVSLVLLMIFSMEACCYIYGRRPCCRSHSCCIKLPIAVASSINTDGPAPA